MYAPPYAAYPASSYDGYGGYSYAEPVYAYPPATIGLGFSYYDRGPRHHGRHGWGHRHRGGHHYPGRGRPRR